MAKILFTHSPRDLEFFYTTDALDRLSSHCELVFNTGVKPLCDDDLLSLAPNCDIIISEWTTGATSTLFKQNRNLIAFIRCGVEMLNVDFKAATQEGVLIVSTPAQFVQSVAEFTFGSILALARGIVNSHNAVCQGRMRYSFNFGVSKGIFAQVFPGFEIAGETLGLIGLGAIGRHVANIAHAFGLKCIAYDPYISMHIDKIKIVSLEHLLTESRFVSLHSTLNEQTRHLIGDTQLRMMRSDAYIINTARGAIIDENALVHALKNGNIAGAALDVFEHEPDFSNTPLLDCPNVILTPHIAGLTYETIVRQANACTDIALKILGGHIPDSVVNHNVLTQKVLRISNGNS